MFVYDDFYSNQLSLTSKDFNLMVVLMFFKNYIVINWNEMVYLLYTTCTNEKSLWQMDIYVLTQLRNFPVPEPDSFIVR